MGFFSDAKAARAIEPTDVIVVPAARIDTDVLAPSGERRRRSDYAGTVWYGGRPQLLGENVLSGTSARVEAPFWLPDSLSYQDADAQIQVTAALQCAHSTSAGATFAILDVSAALGPHPQHPEDLRVVVTIVAVARLPLGVAYRVTVVGAPTRD